jgi:hypothetical protein
LPPSPVTVRRAAFAEEDVRGASSTHVTQNTQKMQKLRQVEDELEEYERLVAEAQREQQLVAKSEQFFANSESQNQVCYYLMLVTLPNS